MSYEVGIDLGTCTTVAAVCRPDGTARVVPPLPSAVYVAADGTLLVGKDAQRRALSDPARVVRELTSRIGDSTPVLVGREPVAAADLAARFLTRVVGDVARQEGGVAARVAVTHPAGWGPHRVGSLRAALAEHGLGSALLVAEPVAAAVATAAAVPQGALVGVHDLGGGRCTAAVVRRGPDGFVLAGPAEEVGFGGADLDEAVVAHVRAALGTAWDGLDPADPDVLAAVADLRRECTAAKEALSRDTEVLIPVVLPGSRTRVRLGRAEFEEMIRSDVAGTVEAVRRALDGAGTAAGDLAALVLVGGSAQVPLVPQLLGDEFGREVTVAPDPVGAVAIGAALLAHGLRPEAGPRRVPRDPGGPVERHPAAVGPVERHPAPVGPEAAHPAPGAAGSKPVPTAAGPATQPQAVDAGGTAVLPVARPPKQARPFTAGTITPPSRFRRMTVVAAAGALALAVLGGVVAFGVGRIGAGAEAGAVTPVVATEAPTSVVTPPPTVAPPSPARTAAPPATRRARPAPPAPTSAPPTTTQPPVTTPPTTTTEEPEPTQPAGGGNDDADGGGGGNDGGNGGGGNDGNGGAENADEAGGGAANEPAAAGTPAAAAPVDDAKAAAAPDAPR